MESSEHNYADVSRSIFTGRVNILHLVFSGYASLSHYNLTNLVFVRHHFSSL